MSGKTALLCTSVFGHRESFSFSVCHMTLLIRVHVNTVKLFVK